MRNCEIIQGVVNYIEDHPDEKPDLDTISRANGYSVYHLSRMFSACTDLSVHEYIVRRKLTEAAGKLVHSDRRIIDIALESGYENQQSFTVAFAGLYGITPAQYRANRVHTPVQLVLHVSPGKHLEGDRIMNIRTEKGKGFSLVGFSAGTDAGFHVIGMCWGQLHGRKQEIRNRTDRAYLIGLNDYSACMEAWEGQPAFVYYACAEVSSFDDVPAGMVTRQLPVSDYVVFTYRGHAEDSMEPVVNYIYREWFPESTCVLNENARFDLVRYGEDTDAEGNSTIEYWVPVK